MSPVVIALVLIVVGAAIGAAHAVRVIHQANAILRRFDRDQD